MPDPTIADSFCSVVNRRRRATPVMTSTFENVSDIGVCLGLCLAPPANAGVRLKGGAVQSAPRLLARKPLSRVSIGAPNVDNGSKRPVRDFA
jgi:hypothetical protein